MVFNILISFGDILLILCYSIMLIIDFVIDLLGAPYYSWFLFIRSTSFGHYSEFSRTESSREIERVTHNIPYISVLEN